MPRIYDSSRSVSGPFRRRFLLRRFGLRPGFPPLSADDALLARAELRARRKLLFLQALPLRLLILAPFAILLSTQNKAALMITILVLGTVYLPIAMFLACFVTDVLEPLDVHLRREVSRLRGVSGRQGTSANGR
jgi:hypothetical protein